MTPSRGFPFWVRRLFVIWALFYVQGCGDLQDEVGNYFGRQAAKATYNKSLELKASGDAVLNSTKLALASSEKLGAEISTASELIAESREYGGPHRQDKYRLSLG